MKTLIFLTYLLSTPLVSDDLTKFNYAIGKIAVSENEDEIIIHTNPPVKISILLGGETWPRLSLDEAGIIYAGNVVIEPNASLIVPDPIATLVLPNDLAIIEARGGFEFRRHEKTCYFSPQQLGITKRKNEINTLKNSSIKFSSATNGLLALVRRFGDDGQTSSYFVNRIDLASCQIRYRSDLGDPDFLIELNYSTQGGWWITGSIEQTLLQSSDGVHWRNASLPPKLGGLISAYVVNPWEIWLAARISTDGPESPYELVYSGDGGVTWRNVLAGDPVLQSVPRGWLEGQKRLAHHQ